MSRIFLFVFLAARTTQLGAERRLSRHGGRHAGEANGGNGWKKEMRGSISKGKRIEKGEEWEGRNERKGRERGCIEKGYR